MNDMNNDPLKGRSVSVSTYSPVVLSTVTKRDLLVLVLVLEKLLPEAFRDER